MGKVLNQNINTAQQWRVFYYVAGKKEIHYSNVEQKNKFVTEALLDTLRAMEAKI